MGRIHKRATEDYTLTIRQENSWGAFLVVSKMNHRYQSFSKIKIDVIII